MRSVPCVLRAAASGALLLAAAVLPAQAALPDYWSGIAIEDLDGRLAITRGNQLVTEYHYRGFSRPILYPLHAPGGARVVRHWPMRDDVPGEQPDHPHQRSLWFAHGAVNGHDFWSEAKGAGRIEHVAFDQVGVVDGVGVVRARNEWRAASGEVVCTESRTLRFVPDADAVVFDFDVTLHASHGPLLLGDTKEGSMAIRLHPALRLRGAVAQGQCVTSEGVRGRDAWGKRARWVDYHGPVEGQVVGVALFDHPGNHAHPTWWHARDYGLLAANPFGAHDFEQAPPGTGDLQLEAGGELALRYRFVVHRGDATQARVAERYAEYASGVETRALPLQAAADLARLTCTDAAAWRVRDGALELFGASDYRAAVRSPHNIALWSDVEVGDFTLEAQLQQTGREYGHRDLCLFFGVERPDRYYYVHLASKADAHAHNVFLVDGADRRAIATETTAGIDWGRDAWHRVRVERRLGDSSIAVFFDDMTTPIMTARDRTLGKGRVGFGSFDDTGRFKDVRLTAPAVEQPAAPFWFRRPPNVVFIMADDLGYAELGCYGQQKIRTPHIDRLAAEGMRFTQFYSGAPVCAPARCVLMTGMHSGHATIRDNFEHKPEGQEPIRQDDVTMAEVLAQAGYACGCFGKWGLGFPGSEGDPLAQGFDRFYGYNCQRHAHNFYPRYLWSDDQKVTLEGNDRGATGAQYSHDLIERETLAFLEQNKDRPFFCYVPFTIPHLALQVPDESLAEYRGQWPETPYRGKSYLPHDTPRAAYAAMVTHMDKSVGRILQKLERLGLEDDTLVVFTSDNGVTHLKGQVDYDFFSSSGPLRGQKGSVFEGGIRVPLVARWPGKIAAGSESDHIAGFHDVLPTLAQLAGTTPAAEVDGLSFLPTLLGEGEQARHDYLFWDFPGYGGQLAVRMGDWKAVRRGLRKDPDAPLQLFDLAADVGETTDVAAEHPEVAARMAAVMLEARSEPIHDRFRFGAYR